LENGIFDGNIAQAMKNKIEITGAVTKVWSTGKNNQLFFLIDTSDLVKIERFTWRIYVTKNGYCRVESGIFRNKKKISIILSRFILDAPHGVYVDHKDCNPTNNCRHNLRLCNTTENAQNAPKHSIPTTSKFKGVCFHKKKKLWFAYINANKKRYNIGYFRNEHDAAIAYNNKAKELFTDYAYFNEV
jgi:hypothetical protein